MSRLLFALAALLTLAACGGDEPPATPDPAAPPQTADASAAAPPAFDGPPAEITLTPVGETMAYEQTEFTVQPGQTVRLTFRNTATNATMNHNVVVLAAGADANAVGQAAMEAVATDYIPEAMADQILAHTAMAAPGETVTVEFTAPAAGDYTYICTFPGHFMMMKGVMRVAAA